MFLFKAHRIHRSAHHRHAFTLVELLTVVLILAILLAVALPLYLGAVNNSTRNTVRSNLHTLICAEQALRVKQPYTADMKLLVSTGMLDAPPVGPGAASYSLYIGGQSTLDGRVVPDGGVAACAEDATRGTNGKYGCFIPGLDKE